MRQATLEQKSGFMPPPPSLEQLEWHYSFEDLNDAIRSYNYTDEQVKAAKEFLGYTKIVEEHIKKDTWPFSKDDYCWDVYDVVRKVIMQNIVKYDRANPNLDRKDVELVIEKINCNTVKNIKRGLKRISEKEYLYPHERKELSDFISVARSHLVEYSAMKIFID